MKYFEYVYLAVAIGLLVFMAFGPDKLNSTQTVAILIGIAVSAFMFSFRRQQRQKLEHLEQEELDEWKSTAEDEEEEDDLD